MPLQSTLRISSGYETDDSNPHRSGRVTTPARLGPGMICPPSDSRQSLPSSSFSFSVNNRASNAKGQAKGKGKRAQSDSVAGTEYDLGNDTDSPVVVSSNIRKIVPARGMKSATGPTQSKKASTSGTKKSAGPSRRKDAEADLASHFTKKYLRFVLLMSLFGFVGFGSQS